MWIELVELTALLLALTMLLTFIFRAWGKDSPIGRFYQGILFGLIAVVGMSIPVNFITGVIFDPRSVVVSMAGFFGGPLAAIPSAIIAGGYRYSLGGAGAMAGTLVVVLSAVAGTFGYYLRQKSIVNTGPLHLFLLGLLGHFFAMFGMLALPADIMWSVVKNLSIPFFIIYPPVTVFLGYLLADIERKFDIEEQFKRSTAQLRSLFDTAPNLIWLKDVAGNYLMCNKRFEMFLGDTEKNIKGKVNREYFDKEQAEEHRSKDLEAIETGAEITYEKWVTFAHEPKMVLLEITKAPVYNADHKLIGVLGVAHDITKRSENESKLRQSAIVFENTLEGVFITDNNNIFLDVNQSFLEITGYSREEVIGNDTGMLRSDKHDQKFYSDIWQSLAETAQWQGEIWYKRKDNSVCPVWLTVNGATDNSGEITNYVAVFNDITEIKESQEKLDYLAHHDALTSLPNRLLFNMRLEQALSHAKRNNTKLAVLFIDLDRFKNINDSFGHKAGDDLLVHLATGLKARIRAEDTIARISGDEFIILFEDLQSTESMVGSIEKIMKTFSRSLVIEGHRIQTTASIGISVYPLDGDSAVDLVRNADAAMYQAKEEGGNTYQFYTQDLTQKALERVIMENELRDALDNNEFYLVYQPQLDLASKKLVGLEALLRWQHPGRNLIPPDQFIPLAEDSGLIKPIGELVLNLACRQGKKWLASGYDFGRIAINISGVQVNRGKLFDSVSKALTESGLPPEHLELEITESAIMKQTESAVVQLNQLRELGVTLSVDDFGTGYSSLSYLKKLPIHKLKVDRSFVHDITNSSDYIAIVEAIIAMGTRLGLTVIAEGVEYAEQEEFLCSAGCHEVQGYFYSKPVSPGDVETRFFLTK